MVIPPYHYYAPTSLEEALDLLVETSEERLPLSGGTDLLVMMKEGRLSPAGLVSLKRISQLKGITRDAETLTIGAGSTVGEIERNGLAADNPAFADLITHMATRQIRNRATIGGNLCTAAACADFPPVLLVNEATVVLKNKRGEQQTAISEFFTGPRRTLRQADQLLTSVTCKRYNPGSAYIKFGVREAANISIVGIACSMTVTKGKISQLIVSSTAASPIPLLVPGATDVALGKEPNSETWAAAADEVVKALSPISDIRGSLDYRLHLAREGTIRALTLAFERWCIASATNAADGTNAADVAESSAEVHHA